jgi:hypothetical protein
MPGQPERHGTEMINTDTGEIRWDYPGLRVNPVPPSISGTYNAQYSQALQNISNSQPGGIPGQLSEDAAQSDPRGTMSNVLLGMSNDFFSTAVPIKDDLISMTTYDGNKGIVGDLKNQGRAQVKQAFSNAVDQADRSEKRYGMQLTKEQHEAQNSALSSGRALAEVDMSNRATQVQQDLNKQLVSGMGSPTGITK